MVDATALMRAFSDALIPMRPAFGRVRDEGNALPPKPEGLPVNLGDDSKSAERESEHQSGEIGCRDFSLL